MAAGGAPNGLTVRPASDADMPAVCDIYADAVLNTAATFEETLPNADEMQRRRAAVKNAGLPYLVAERDGAIAGYCYASPFRPRTAYRFSLECSVYVHRDHRQQGIGRAMLDMLVAACGALGYRQMLAVIGDRDNAGSIRLHSGAGFREVGRLPGVGYKFGRWVDVVVMQRAIGDGDTTPPD